MHMQMGGGGGGSHPVEVVGRVRAHPDARDEQAAVQVQPSGQLRVRAEQGCRDFVLDGVSVGRTESLRAFYTKYVEARIDDVKGGAKCTVMMYGPTGSGKSHTMFGCAQEAGVAYLAMQQLLAASQEEQEGTNPQSPLNSHGGAAVKATVLEIYNEEIFDLLASNSAASPGPRSLKSNPSRTRLEVRGKKVRNATSISGFDAQTLVREISKVERRRVVKSTNCNDRSSRSHCMVIIDVLAVGGRLLLVDMAGSENIEQAGLGIEAKLQTGKINQGTGALKRVVEAIANGDPYIPYRDSKLTMLLQDSFEDDRAKILMVLCLSPDWKDAHKTICTLEYGAKAKTIVRLLVSPLKQNFAFEDELILKAQLRSKDECIKRLRRENEQIQRAKGELEGRLFQQELALSELQQKVAVMEAEKRDQFEQILRLKYEEDGVKQIWELEKFIEEQKHEISGLHSRADKAEAQVKQLQSVICKNDKVTGTITVDAESVMETTQAESLEKELSLSIQVREQMSPDHLCCKPESAYSSTIETQEKVLDFVVDHSNIKNVLFSGSNEMDFLDPYDEENEVSSDDTGLCKTGWLPVIHEGIDEDEDEDGDEDEEDPRDEGADDVASSVTEEPHEIDCGSTCIIPVGSDCGSQGFSISPQKVLKCDSKAGLEDNKVDEKGRNPGSFTSSSQLNLSSPCSSSSIEALFGTPGPIANTESLVSISDRSVISARPGSTVDSQQSTKKELEDAAAARRARIENIFLLCGDRREVAARRNAIFSTSKFGISPCNVRSLKQCEESVSIANIDEPVSRGNLAKTEEADSYLASPNHFNDQGSSRSNHFNDQGSSRSTSVRAPLKHRLFTNPDLATMPFQASENDMPRNGSALESKHEKSLNSSKHDLVGSDKAGKPGSSIRSTVLGHLKGFQNIANGNFGEAQGVTFVEKARGMHVQGLASRFMK